MAFPIFLLINIGWLTLLICLHKNNTSLHKNASINSIDLPFLQLSLTLTCSTALIFQCLMVLMITRGTNLSNNFELEEKFHAK